jgi:hypothetical protein
LLLVLLLPASNYRRCHGIDENLGQGLFTGVNDTSNNLSPVTTAPVIIYHQDRDTDDQLFTCVNNTGEKKAIRKYLGKFS